jgi:hypothetical protein
MEGNLKNRTGNKRRRIFTVLIFVSTGNIKAMVNEISTNAFNNYILLY